MFKNLSNCSIRFSKMAVLAIMAVISCGALASATEPYYRYSGSGHRTMSSHSSHWGSQAKSSSYYAGRKTPACGSYYGSHKSSPSPYYQNSIYHQKQKYSRGY